MIVSKEVPVDQPDRPAPACEACREATLRGEVVYCSCLRIPVYTVPVVYRA